MIIIGGNNGNKDDEITIDVDGPFDPGDWVDTLTINSPIYNQFIKIGITPGGDELIRDTEIFGGNFYYDFSLHRTSIPGDIFYISGLTHPVNIKIHR